jgi:hypothetical protein
MAKGIKLPTSAKNGRLELLGGDAYIEQLIAVAMGEGDSDNPFQDLGLGEFMIFDINDALPDGVIRERVRAAFATLERDQLAKLERLEFTTSGVEKTMSVWYKNLETGRRDEIEVPLPPSGG